MKLQKFWSVMALLFVHVKRFSIFLFRWVVFIITSGFWVLRRWGNYSSFREGRRGCTLQKHWIVLNSSVPDAFDLNGTFVTAVSAQLSDREKCKLYHFELGVFVLSVFCTTVFIAGPRCSIPLDLGYVAYIYIFIYLSKCRVLKCVWMHAHSLLLRLHVLCD